MNKYILQVCFVVCITSIVSILSAELILHIAYPYYKTPFTTEGQIFQSDDILGIKPIPNSVGTIIYNTYGHNPGEVVTYQINSKGLRDIEYDYTKTNNHIVLLGDSFIFGAEVNHNNTIDYYLEQSLNDTAVINLGVSSYGTTQEYLYLINEGIKYDPDIVITFVYTGNDGLDNIGLSPSEASSNLKQRPILNGSEIEYVHYPSKDTKKSFKDWLRDKSYIYSVASEIYHKKFRMNLGIIGNEYFNQSMRYDEQINNTVNSLILIDDFCNQNGIKHYVFIIPTGSLVNSMYAEWDGIASVQYNERFKADLSNELVKTNITMVDLTETLQSHYSKLGDVYYNYNGNPGHFTSNGNMIVAQIVSQQFKVVNGKIITKQIGRHIASNLSIHEPVHNITGYSHELSNFSMETIQ